MDHAGTTQNAVSCKNCRYYLITWDFQFPYGCRAHTFKSKKSPALDVFEASGLQCLLFAPKGRQTAQQACSYPCST